MTSHEPPASVEVPVDILRKAVMACRCMATFPKLAKELETLLSATPPARPGREEILQALCSGLGEHLTPGAPVHETASQILALFDGASA